MTAATGPGDTPLTQIHHLEIVVAHHEDNEFYTLARLMPASGGGFLDWNATVVSDVTHEVPPASLFHALPDAPCNVDGGPARCERWCVIIDACDEAGDIVADREVPQEVADRLLDGTFEARLERARGNLADYYTAAKPA